MNTYIEILKYGKNRLESGTTYLDLYNHLEKNKLTFPNSPLSMMHGTLQYIFANSFVDYKGNKPTPEEFTNNLMHYPFYLTMESLSFLSNYEMLELTIKDSEAARSEAKKAIELSTKSFWIAILTLAISTLISIFK